MRVLDTEIRTIHAVSVTFADYVQSIFAYQQNKTVQDMFPEAHAFEYNRETPVWEVREAFEFCLEWRQQSWDALAYLLGYDGACSCGKYDRETGDIIITLYLHGDHLG